MKNKPPSERDQITLGFRVHRSRLNLINAARKYRGFQKTAQWLSDMFEKELTRTLTEMTEKATETTNAPAQPTT